MNIAKLRESIRLGSSDPWADSVFWKSAPSPPPAPDYSGAATATAAGNRENSIAAQQGSMVNQYTPYGNLTYSPRGDSANGNPQYSANYSLTPEAQQTLDSQLSLSNNMGNLANSAAGRTDAAYAQPFDMKSVQDIADKSYAAQTARLDPQWAAATQSNDAQLSNQGIVQGSEAYNNAKRTFDQGKNDAYSQARQNAISTMPTTYQLESSAREQPLNELNAIRTGAQVQNPQFQAQPSQSYTPGPDMLGAATAQNGYNMGVYNSGVGQSNSFNNGLFSLGAAAAPYALSALSDRRLKSNIVRIGTHKRGIGLYEYDIAGIRTQGVMADEVLNVMPSAVHTLPSGYMTVNYGRLDG